MNFELGTRIYYTGDMANAPGNFEVSAIFNTGHVTLRELNGERVFRGIYLSQIGDVYEGTCNPRFVTEEARAAFFAELRRTRT